MKQRLLPISLALACATNGKPAKEEVETQLEAQNAAPEGPPPAKKVTVNDTYHGVSIADDYRWLEDWDDGEVKAWSETQNEHARKMLSAIPGREALTARVTEIMKEETSSHFELQLAGKALFAMEHRPPKQQPFLVVMGSVDGASSARVVVDPNAIDPSGKTHIDWYVASPKGDHVAVSMSVGGTESGDVHVYEVASGKETFEVVPGVNGGTAGGDLAWSPDGKSFFYTRYPRGDERPAEDKAFYQQLYHHTLGKPTAEDRYELGKDLPRIAEIQLEMDAKSGRLLATVQNGDGGEFAHYLRSPKGEWKQLTAFPDAIVQMTFGPKEDLYVISNANAPKGKILRVPLKDPNMSKAKVVIPEGSDTVVADFWGPPTLLPTKSRLYVTYQLGGPSEVRAFDLEGKAVPGPQVPAVSAVSGLVRSGDDDLIFRQTSFVDPPAFFHFDAKKKATRRTSLASTSAVKFEGVKVVREMATSKDGTQVPVNIMIPATAKLDGSDPCLAYGYGGYGVALTPRFQPTIDVLMSRGMIYAVANLRGGSEYGEDWHTRGNLTNKQNVFDDFAAVLEHLVAKKYTSPARLGIMGGSNGGLLMGAVMTQHPEMMKAVVSSVGIYDMLRVELSPNGAFNIPEFGTVKEKAHFDAMYAYSPYHRVKDGTVYPPTLFLTGANDPRVDPMQSRKMTARLQAASPGSPILLRTTMDAGHGGGTNLDERVAQVVDSYAFLFHHLGVAQN
jgi:prolyl oligopeptidase